VFLRSIFLLFVVWLCGCASAPELEKRDLPVPKTWNEGATDGAQAARVHWRNFFPDPHLQALIALALENNRDLRIAAARVLEARAQYGISKADRLPSGGLNGSGAFVTTPTDLLSAGSSPTTERYDLGVSVLSYELDFWGRLSGMSESARYSYLASEESRRAVQISLVADVASAYFSYIQMRDAVDMTRSTVELRQQSLLVVGKGKELGGAYELEYQTAAALLESAQSSLDGARHQQNQALNRLNFLIGNSMPGQPEAGSLSDQGLDTVLASGLPSEILLLRPDVATAEQRLRAAHANIDAARAAFMPKVMLTATAGLASQGLASLFSGAAWAFQPSITLPLFDGGRLSSGLELAEARKIIAVAEYEKTVQLAFREVADLLSARVVLARQLKSALANRTAQGKLLEIANARYTIGLGNYLAVLEAQRDFIGSSQTVMQVRKVQLDTTAQLYKALGGGGDV
jgi:multidrug efflux system outer membrane protein